jgi:hypothetical protein
MKDDPSLLRVGLTIALLFLGITLIKECGPRAQAFVEPDVLSMGIVNFSEHELDAGGVGYFAIGHSEKQGTVIMAPVDSSTWLRLRSLKDRKVTILVRIDE